MNNQHQEIPVNKIKILPILISVITSSAVTFFITYNYLKSSAIVSPLGKTLASIINKEKPLEKYSFLSLSQRDFSSSQIILEKVLEETKDFDSYLFSIQVEGQKVTGQLNIPTKTPSPEGFPIIVLNRGFIEPEIYKTGMGTSNAASYYARNGFITIAPDFLGFGESDKEDDNSMAARVKKPVTTITILHSLSTLNNETRVDVDKVFMWGHSNGGQISISVLEILGNSPYWNQTIPTTLWAPVSKGFPYNILYYTDDGDYGKALRKVLFEFELEYDTDKYSIHKYIDWIDSPIQIHQGGADEWIPTKWSRDFSKSLSELNKDVQLYVYNDTDHNLRPNWENAIRRDLNFFNSYID